MNKIKDNPSYAKMRKDIEGADALKKVLKIANVFGVNVGDTLESLGNLSELRAEFEKLSSMPDRFNEHFSKDGWIAYESMNSELMDKTVTLANQDQYEQAKELLTDFYCSDDMKCHIAWLKNIQAFEKRHHLTLLAWQDTQEGRYYSAIPLLLMIIDGGVNDINKNKGFFAESTDLNAWDSIAAHSTGLSVIRDIFTSTRNKTTTEPITLPYRNGILHGRDLGYANKEIAAKCWATLFAVYDWAIAIKQGKKTPPSEEPPKTLKETLADIRDTQKQIVKNRIIKDKIEKWQPRSITVGIDIPESAPSNEYANNSPEQEAVRFMEYWQVQNYGFIAKQLYLPLQHKNYGKEAKRIRDIFEDKKLIGFKIINVIDEAPAISEVIVNVEFEHGEKCRELIITMRFIYEAEDGSPSVRDYEDGKWHFIDSFFYEIEIDPTIFNSPKNHD